MKRIAYEKAQSGDDSIEWSGKITEFFMLFQMYATYTLWLHGLMSEEVAKRTTNIIEQAYKTLEFYENMYWKESEE